jgi:hypothetical protein
MTAALLYCAKSHCFVSASKTARRTKGAHADLSCNCCTSFPLFDVVLECSTVSLVGIGNDDSGFEIKSLKQSSVVMMPSL